MSAIDLYSPLPLQFTEAKTQSIIRANSDHCGRYAKQNW